MAKTLVTAEEAQMIAQEVRADFRAALAKTEKLATELDALGRLQARRESPAAGMPAVKPSPNNR